MDEAYEFLEKFDPNSRETLRAEIDALLDDIRKEMLTKMVESYQRGWTDAMALFLKPSQTFTEPCSCLPDDR